MYHGRTSIDWLQPHLDRLCTSQEFGMIHPFIKQLRSSMPSCYANAASSCDSFIFAVPYAEIYVDWGFTFNYQHPDIGPEFSCEDDDFEPDLDLIDELASWNVDDDTSLLRIILQYIDQFKTYNIKKAYSNPCLLPLMEEFFGVSSDSLVKTLSQRDKNASYYDSMDLMIQNTGEDAGKVTFIFELNPPDCDNIPDKIMDLLVGLGLKIHMRNYGEGRRYTKIMMNPDLNKLLGGYKLPTLTVHDSFVTYITDVENELSEQLREKTGFLELKKRVFDMIRLVFTGQEVEYDDEEFSFVSLLLSEYDFDFIANISLGPHFETKRLVVITFKSIYHEAKSETLFEKKTSLPLDEDLEPKDIVACIGKHIKEKVKAFQTESCTNGK